VLFLSCFWLSWWSKARCYPFPTAP